MLIDSGGGKMLLNPRGARNDDGGTHLHENPQVSPRGVGLEGHVDHDDADNCRGNDYQRDERRRRGG
jgi:hypothetical protein